MPDSDLFFGVPWFYGVDNLNLAFKSSLEFIRKENFKNHLERIDLRSARPNVSHRQIKKTICIFLHEVGSAAKVWA